GPACYCSIAAKNQKFDSILYTKFGNDFPKEILLTKNINFENALSSQLTTKFKIKIDGSDRTLFLLNTCEPIDYSTIDADGVIISPAYHEISNDVYEKIQHDSNFTFLDPQGFLRRIDSEKKIILEKTYIDLSKISAIKVSPDELFCLTNNSGIEAMKNLQSKGVENVIGTNKREISMLVKDKLYSITLPKLELFDTTGIGDIFSSTFCCTMLKEKDFFWALCFAGGAAQAAIESKKSGLDKIPSKGSTETNAAYFYNQVKFKQV
ncbi:MAG TPA: PfkB family carbohydrate kinase, partial [Nitrosopumilaceae archaeon]|nr:PfkB family carbohydrate kinase [Nitrosopumilaceae archaeon]